MLQLVRRIDKQIEVSFNRLPWFLRYTVGILFFLATIWFISEWWPKIYEVGNEFGRELYRYFHK